MRTRKPSICKDHSPTTTALTKVLPLIMACRLRIVMVWVLKAAIGTTLRSHRTTPSRSSPAWSPSSTFILNSMRKSTPVRPSSTPKMHVSLTYTAKSMTLSKSSITCLSSHSLRTSKSRPSKRQWSSWMTFSPTLRTVRMKLQTLKLLQKSEKCSRYS